MERMVDTHVSHNMYDDKDAWRVAVRSAWLASRRFDAALSNETVENDDNDHFRRCWRRQDCKSCLGVSACSWCPFSATCVPNDHLVPALAPAWEGDLVCPYWAERWELRTRPLGCQVSTITSLTALVAGSGTLVVALLLWLVVVGVRRLRSWRSSRTWFRRRRGASSPAPEEAPPPQAPPPRDEQTPLLSDIR